MKPLIVIPVFDCLSSTSTSVTCYAAKPRYSHPVDAHNLVVVHDATSALCPFVVHDLNTTTGGMTNGRYCTTLAEAFEIFNAVEYH